MKAIILDMHGVVMKDPTANLVSFIESYFPGTTFQDIYPIWKLAEIGKITSLQFWESLGFHNNLLEIEQKYLSTLEIDNDFYTFANYASKNFDLILLSNDVSEWNSYIREKYGLDKYFKISVVSGNIGIRKPSREMFSYLLRALKQEPEACFFVDDRRQNLHSALSLGINPILFNRRKVEYTGIQVQNFCELNTYFQSFL